MKKTEAFSQHTPFDDTNINLDANENIFGDVIIVGLGPAGLMAALEAAKLDKKVIAFSDREKYTRGQLVLLTKSTFDILKTYSDKNNLEDNIFLESAKTMGMAQIKDIEKFLYRKLHLYPKVKIISTKDVGLESAGNAKGISFIKLNDGRKFYAPHIIAADGEKRQVCNLMKQDLNINIEYEARDEYERHRYHGAVQLQRKYPALTLSQESFDAESDASIDYIEEHLSKNLEGKNGLILNRQDQHLYYYEHNKATVSRLLPKASHPMNAETITVLKNTIMNLNDGETKPATLKERHMVHSITAAHSTKPIKPIKPIHTAVTVRDLRPFFEMGWEQLFYPNFYILSNATRTKFYFVGEIPHTIFAEDNLDKKNEDLKKWACLAIEKELGYEPENLEIRQGRPDKDKLQSSTFLVKHAFCKNILTRLPGGFFAPLGDAQLTPNYNLGSGLNNAIIGAKALINGTVNDHKPNPNAYKNWVTQNDASLLEKTPKSVKTTALTNKLLDAARQLLNHLSSNNKNIVSQEALIALKIGIDKAQANEGGVALYDALTKIHDPIQQHQHTKDNPLYKGARAIVSIFAPKVKDTKSLTLLDKAKEATHDLLQYRPYGH